MKQKINFYIITQPDLKFRYDILKNSLEQIHKQISLKYDCEFFTIDKHTPETYKNDIAIQQQIQQILQRRILLPEELEQIKKQQEQQQEGGSQLEQPVIIDGKKKRRVKKSKKVKKSLDNNQDDNGSEISGFTMETIPEEEELGEEEKALREIEIKEKQEKQEAHDMALKQLDTDKETVEKAKEKTFYQKTLAEIDPENYVEFFRKCQDTPSIITPNIVTNYLNHYEALKTISEDEKDQENTFHIVLEDDILTDTASHRKLKSVLKNVSNYDIVFLSLLSKTPWEEQQKMNSAQLSDYFSNYKTLSAINSYLVSKETAKKMCDNYFGTVFQGHFQFTWLCRSLNINTQQAIPSVFVEGSKYGHYTSTIFTDNNLTMNGNYMVLHQKLANTINDSEKSDEEKNQIYDELEKSLDTQLQTFSSPDFMKLKCLLMFQQKKYKESIKYFNDTMEIYKKHKAVLNRHSAFLRAFIAVYKNIEI